MKKKRNIADKLKPTLENVSTKFITYTMPTILFSDEFPNFKFEFREDKAIAFVERVLQDYISRYSNYDDCTQPAQKVLESIKQKSNGNETKPVMIINNYKQFFELLRQYYEKDIQLFFERTGFPTFQVYELENSLEQIWLRATPEDFNNPERFLKRQVDMIRSNTFEKYRKETYLGGLRSLDDNILCVKDVIARTWDESAREMEIIIYDKRYYDGPEFVYSSRYELPVIRYGICKENGQNVCYIGSIQNKTDDYRQSELKKKVNRKKYKINEGVPKEETTQVEPKNILALSVFVSLLNREDITEIKIPGMYVLDYEYHEKRNKKLLAEFEKDWPDFKREQYPENYQRDLYYFQKGYNKEDLISEIKTERLLLTSRRLLQHFPKGIIKSYPGEADSFLHLSIPVIKSENEINGDMLKELYNLVLERDEENER